MQCAPAVFADVVFLCERKETGRAVVSELTKLGIHTIHTFAEQDDAARQQKRYFFKGDARVKATTIHSFKGWEGPHLVVATADTHGARGLSAIYTALTRLKSSPHGSRLTVISASPELDDFGRKWPRYRRTAAPEPPSL